MGAAARRRDAGIIDEDIDAAVALLDLAPERIDRNFDRNVVMHRLRREARLLGKPGGFFRALEIAIGADHVGAERRKAECEGAAEPVARPGNDRELFVETEEIVEHLCLPCPLTPATAARIASRRHP